MKRNNNYYYGNCIICGQAIKGFGCNPAPIFNEGWCCESCDKYIVMPRRNREWIIKRKENKH